MPRNIDTQLLRTFTAIADSGGFAKAGEALHLTQSAVSQQMRRLEEQLRVALFERQGRTMVLSDAGEELLSYARKMITLHDEMFVRLSSQEKINRLRLGLPEHFSDTVLPRIISRFNARYPDIRLDIRIDISHRLTEALAIREVDVAATISTKPSSGESLATDKLHWVGAPKFRRKKREPVPLVLFDGNCGFRAAAIDALEAQGDPWRIAFASPNFASLRAAVKANLGVTVLLKRSPHDGMRLLAEQDGLPSLPHCSVDLHFAPGRRSRVAEDLAKLMGEAFLETDDLAEVTTLPVGDGHLEGTLPPGGVALPRSDGDAGHPRPTYIS